MATHPPKRIEKLSAEVINRIAAGEVVQRPCNALKELIENALDAQSTSISILLNNGGMNELRIEDNGCGILKEDFKLLCERFATSKITSFNDLQSIATYGFRGEALASISYVSQLYITSKVANSVCAYYGEFTDGKLVSKHNENNNSNTSNFDDTGAASEAMPTPVAGMIGTQISAKNLFYNQQLRRSALLKKVSAEFNACLKIVSYYAIHNPKVSFTLKKIGSGTK